MLLLKFPFVFLSRLIKCFIFLPVYISGLGGFTQGYCQLLQIHLFHFQRKYSSLPHSFLVDSILMYLLSSCLRHEMATRPLNTSDFSFFNQTKTAHIQHRLLHLFCCWCRSGLLFGEYVLVGMCSVDSAASMFLCAIICKHVSKHWRDSASWVWGAVKMFVSTFPWIICKESNSLRLTSCSLSATGASVGQNNFFLQMLDTPQAYV